MKRLFSADAGKRIYWQTTKLVNKIFNPAKIETVQAANNDCAIDEAKINSLCRLQL